MKKIIIFILISIVLFLFTNYKAIVSEYFNYKGSSLYDNGSFSGAFLYHNGSLQNKQTPEVLHNLGNDSFKLGELNEDLQKKFELYNSALEFYSGSLNISENLETRENYNYVLNKIREESERQENKEQDKKQEEQDENKPDQNPSLSKSGSISEENTGVVIELSESNMKEIKDYVEKLKKQQAQNGQYFNKEKQSATDSNNFFFGNFINDPFFQDVFDRGGEKDW